MMIKTAFPILLLKSMPHLSLKKMPIPWNSLKEHEKLGYHAYHFLLGFVAEVPDQLKVLPHGPIAQFPFSALITDTVALPESTGVAYHLLPYLGKQAAISSNLPFDKFDENTANAPKPHFSGWHRTSLVMVRAEIPAIWLPPDNSLDHSATILMRSWR
ncbi:MAG: hypothetical protein R3B47_10755 [Bacteroidia bacterium]